MLFAVHPLHLHRRPSRLGEARRWRELWGEWGHGVTWTKACEPHKSQSLFGKKIPKRFWNHNTPRSIRTFMENLGGNVCFIMTICDMESLCLILLAKIHDLVLGHPKDTPIICRQENVAIFSCRCFLYFGSMCQLLYTQVKYLGWKESEGPSDDQFWRQFFSPKSIGPLIGFSKRSYGKPLGWEVIGNLFPSYTPGYILSLHSRKKRSFVAEGRSNRFHVFEGWLPAASLFFWFVVSLVDVYTASFRGTNGVQEPWSRVEKYPYCAGLFF